MLPAVSFLMLPRPVELPRLLSRRSLRAVATFAGVDPDAVHDDGLQDFSRRRWSSLVVVMWMRASEVPPALPAVIRCLVWLLSLRVRRYKRHFAPSSTCSLLPLC